MVDDEEMVLRATEVLFASSGFQVLTAQDGQEAVRVFAEHSAQIVCVVLDVTMPRMGGEEVYHELRRLQPSVRVILTSGYIEAAVMERFVGQPIFGFVQKPEPLDGMIHRLQQALKEAA